MSHRRLFSMAAPMLPLLVGCSSGTSEPSMPPAEAAVRCDAPTMVFRAKCSDAACLTDSVTGQLSH